MALGLSNIDRVKLGQNQALRICKDELSKQLGELRSTNKTLSSWAENTAIGTETQENINKLLDGIDGLINLSRVLCGTVGDYVYNQEQLNRNGSR